MLHPRPARGPPLKRAPPGVSHLFCSKQAYLSGIGRFRLPLSPLSPQLKARKWYTYAVCILVLVADALIVVFTMRDESVRTVTAYEASTRMRSEYLAAKGR